MSKLLTHRRSGFTLLELMLTLAILGVLFALTVVNLTNIIPTASTRSAGEVLVADLREQQMKAMSGYEAITGGASDYGIYFDTDHYVLFTGDSYTEGAQENFEINLQGGLEFDTTDLPLSMIVFSKGSGEVMNYSSTYHTITIDNVVSKESRTLLFNQLGVFEIL
ncbi:prepilin-type N-terminal cleavage/methylation domain-containing protein [Candidatus Woesebacteria bacterium]|nr:prepilin-type N-terminal cleavage/methylation domain-containing protein [Candidatus Woesebacteria bacterium]